VLSRRQTLPHPGARLNGRFEAGVQKLPNQMFLELPILRYMQESISRMGERKLFPENSWYWLLACCSTFT
jgi:hypothetical protein